MPITIGHKPFKHLCRAFLCTVALAASPVYAECDIQLNQSAFTEGETVVIDVFRLANTGSSETAVEMKFWFGLPVGSPVSIINLGGDGSFVLPAGLDVDLGPIPLFTVDASFPEGDYELSCRMLDPVTGALLHEDINSFTIGQQSQEPAPSNPGEVVFNEIMANPEALPDAEGEWLELMNQGSETYNLRDCVIGTAGSAANVLIGTDLLIGVAEYRTFARSAAPGFTPDYDYGASGMTLPNSGQTLTLTCNGVVIDQVVYPAATPGNSLARIPDGTGPWCTSLTGAYGSGDIGSPGAANIDCQ